MKNFIKSDHSCPDEQHEVCTGRDRCGQVKKVRNFLILLGFAMVAATYLAVFPDANQLRSLQAQVKPFASLYANPKKLDKALSLVNEKKQAVLLSEIINKQWMLLLFNNAQCNANCVAELAKLNQIIKKSKNEEKTQAIYISADPKRDIVKFSKLNGSINPNFLSLAIDNKNLEKISEELGIHPEVIHKKSELKQGQKQNADPTNQSNAFLDKPSAGFFLVNPDFELTATLSTANSSEQIAKTLDLIIQTLN